jgi:FAD/FMN-containing dehydrogenase/Fe-S oxidoreductase
MHASERLADFAAALRPRLAGDLRLDRLQRALYATDASMYQVEPLGVLLPRHRDDVLAAVEEAARFGLPVLPRGSGSSLAGSAVGAALVVDTTRHLDAVLALDVEARTVTVEPGVILDGLNRRLAAHDLMVGPDPASSSRATLGGMVATNATGTHSIRYGSVVDHLREVEAVLPDGTPARFGDLDAGGWGHKTRLAGVEGDLYRALDALLAEASETVRRDTPAHWRRAGGYRLEHLLDPEVRNVAHLLCGSEGTLGFITEATLGLVERPARTALGVAHFESRAAALEAVSPILETDPSAVELFDRIALRRAYDVTEYRPRLRFIQGDPAALLIVEYYGASDAELTDRLDALGRVLGPKGVVTRCALGAEIADVWAVRKMGLGLAMSARLPTQALAFIEDAAVPVEHLPAYIARLEAVLAEHGTEVVVYAHASAGCLHVRPFLDTRQPRDLAAMESIARASAELVREYGGIISSEHGDGLARSWLAPTVYGPALYEAYRGVKRAFDPEGRFNPGRVVEAPPMTENLRHPPGQQTIPVLTDFDWSRDGGFAAAVERCNGNGACRKRDVGAMCPSFMVTRDEKDSTRGRANALRQVLSGVLPPEALTGPEIAEVMDLCVSCKACQAECPAQVDLAALKSEWQAMVWKTRRPPLRTRLIAHLPEVSRRAAGRLAPLLNAPGGTRLARALLERVLGLAAARKLPPFARHPFSEAEVVPSPPGGGLPPAGRGAERRRDGGVSLTPSPPPSLTPSGDRVALYADTFSRFHEPEVPRAALAVLQAAGFAVEVPPYRCCGRTLISKGFLPEARRKAEALVETLHPWAAEGVPIVGLEPSCILTLRDELRRLAPEDPRTETVAQAALTFEEFVAAHRARFEALPWREGERRALLHAHCHQKALSGTAPSVACLEAGGFDVEALDSGCCGMAGAFGYEAEHLEVSRAMGERVLAPAVRQAEAGTAVAAAGTSCRAQIADLTGREGQHPAVLLAETLDRSWAAR